MLNFIIILLRTLFSRLMLIILMIIWAIPVAVYMAMPQSIRYESRFFFWLASLFYRLVLKAALIPIKYEGLEHVPTLPAIIAANHQSSFDIPLLGSLVNGHPHIWLALAALRKSILLRYILPRIAVLVDTSTPMKGMRTLLQVMNISKDHNTHIMIFPEGGRFTDGTVHKFFGGFALLARRMERPVVPVYIHGINKVYPPNSFLVHWHSVTVVVGAPFTIGQAESDDEFVQRVHAWFVDHARKEHQF